MCIRLQASPRLIVTDSHDVRITVRSEDKAQKLLNAHKSFVDAGKLDYAIVRDIAEPNAFDEAVKSDKPFEAILHTASPFHFNVTDIKKELLDPAINGTVGILKSAKAYAPSVKKVVSAVETFEKQRPNLLNRSSLPLLRPLSTLAKASGQSIRTARPTGTPSPRLRLSRTRTVVTVHRRPLLRRLLGSSLRR